MEWLVENWDQILIYATAVVGAASVIAKVTPSETDNKVLLVLSKFLQTLSLNTTKAGPKSGSEEEKKPDA